MTHNPTMTEQEAVEGIEWATREIVALRKRNAELEAALQGSAALPSEAIKHMANRFLSWRLPENFHPDNGISFKPTFNDHLPEPMKHNPTGTNLFDADQAEKMVRYMAEGLPMRAATPTAPVQDDDAELIAEWIRLENAFHDALPSQGECGDPEPGKALCQFLYDNSERIRSRLSPTPDTGLIEALDDSVFAYTPPPTSGQYGYPPYLSIERKWGKLVVFVRSEPEGHIPGAAASIVLPLEEEAKLYAAITALANASPAQPERLSDDGKLEPDTRARLEAVTKTLETCGAHGIPIDFAMLAHDIRTALASRPNQATKGDGQ